MHWRPELVTHVHQKRGFRLVGLIGLLLGRIELDIHQLQPCPLGVQLRACEQNLLVTALQTVVGDHKFAALIEERNFSMNAARYFAEENQRCRQGQSNNAGAERTEHHSTAIGDGEDLGLYRN